jgi:signal transduction histidine kinase/ActR/RegA family two-component response regulator
MTSPTASERLTVVLRAAQYLSNLSPQQDPWAELAQALKSFFRCDLVLIVSTDPAGDLRLVHEFTSGIPAAEIVRLAGDEVRAVLETGFLGSQTFAAPACALAFLPLPRNRRTAAVAIVGRAGNDPFSKEDLEILLALGGLYGNVVARVETERELRQYQQNLEGLVARRTAELEDANARLVREIAERERTETERRKLAERVVQAQKLESLGVLVAGIAHNFNNILAIIMGTVSIREMGEIEPSALESLRTIDTACRRGRALVQSLTHFGRPALPNQVPLELGRLVTEVRLLLASTTRNHIEILERFSGEPLWVLGDPGALSTVLMNLCLNSMDAMPDGGSLTLGTAILPPDRVELSVEDTGEGMTPEILARATEPFFTTKPVDKGTGLGLSITHGVIQAHGGSMEISSVPGRGTQVKLQLPRLQVPDQEETIASPETRVPSRLPSKVLLVDDDDDVRILVARMLRKAGVLQVHSVPGGQEALDCLGSGECPDLVVLDQNMPGLNGVQTMAGIRCLHPALPILISSGQPDIETLECFQRPWVAVIPKPFTMDEMIEKLAHLQETQA